jgi:NADPH2:quinone reductase
MPQRVHRGLMDLWDAGKLHIMVGNVYPLDRAADALREIDSRRAINKVVLSVRR